MADDLTVAASYFRCFPDKIGNPELQIGKTKATLADTLLTGRFKMRRFRVPEIVLGFGLGIIAFLFIAGITSYQTERCRQPEQIRKASTSPEKQINAPTDSGKTNETLDRNDQNLAIFCGAHGSLMAIVDFMDQKEGFFVGTFTGLLVLATVLLWLATNSLWKAAIEQSRDMKKSIEAAQTANELSRQGLIADQRAWLIVKLKAISDFVIDERGAHIEVSATIQNIGKTPAVSVHSAFCLVIGHENVSKAAKTIGDETRGSLPTFSRLVLPTESYDRPWKLTLPAAEFIKLKIGDDILPIVIGSITYKILPDRSVHQTIFLYHLVKQGGPLGDPIPFNFGSTDKNLIRCDVHAGGDAD